MKHPLENLGASAVRRIYWVFLFLTAAVAVGMGELGKYPHADDPPGAAPRSVPTIKFEFADSVEKWEQLAGPVGAAGMAALKRQTYLDYIFLVCYSTVIAAGVIGVSRGLRRPAAVLGARGLAWGAWLSGLLDGVENTGLLLSAAGPLSPVCLKVTAACAVVKFALVIAGVLWIHVLLPVSWRDAEA